MSTPPPPPYYRGITRWASGATVWSLATVFSYRTPVLLDPDDALQPTCQDAATLLNPRLALRTLQQGSALSIGSTVLTALVQLDQERVRAGGQGGTSPIYSGDGPYPAGKTTRRFLLFFFFNSFFSIFISCLAVSGLASISPSNDCIRRNTQPLPPPFLHKIIVRNQISNLLYLPSFHLTPAPQTTSPRPKPPPS